jgi:hypothetical protein
MAATTTERTYPIPSAATLAHVFAALRNYEPDLADAIATAFCHLSHNHRPLLLLLSKQFRQLQAAVAALPHGWRHRTATTLCPSIGTRLRTIAENIPRELLAIVPHIITPQPDMVRIEMRSQGMHRWNTYRNCANPRDYPVAFLNQRYPTTEHRHVPLPYWQLSSYWDDRNSPHNFIQLFANSFPTDVGRLLYGVAVQQARCTPDDHIPQHILRSDRCHFCRHYNNIKKRHVPAPASSDAAKTQLATDRRWLALLGPLR